MEVREFSIQGPPNIRCDWFILVKHFTVNVPNIFVLTTDKPFSYKTKSQRHFLTFGIVVYYFICYSVVDMTLVVIIILGMIFVKDVYKND